jgi:hypothetical protein
LNYKNNKILNFLFFFFEQYIFTLPNLHTFQNLPCKPQDQLLLKLLELLYLSNLKPLLLNKIAFKDFQINKTNFIKKKNFFQKKIKVKVNIL